MYESRVCICMGRLVARWMCVCLYLCVGGWVGVEYVNVIMSFNDRGYICECIGECVLYGMSVAMHGWASGPM